MLFTVADIVTDTVADVFFVSVDNRKDEKALGGDINTARWL